MVMENEIRLGDILDKLTPSDRLVIYNAARQVVYRGFAANAMHSGLNEQRRIKKMGLGMETYRATEKIWDWDLHCLPVHIHGRTIHGLWYILEHAGLTAGF